MQKAIIKLLSQAKSSSTYNIKDCLVYMSLTLYVPQHLQKTQSNYMSLYGPQHWYIYVFICPAALNICPAFTIYIPQHRSTYNICPAALTIYQYMSRRTAAIYVFVRPATLTICIPQHLQYMSSYVPQH